MLYRPLNKMLSGLLEGHRPTQHVADAGGTFSLVVSGEHFFISLVSVEPLRFFK